VFEFAIIRVPSRLDCLRKQLLSAGGAMMLSHA
jgi:hypothetical protein